MVAVERRLDADRIYRSLWRCSNSDSDTDADTNADAYSNAGWGVAQQHTRSARKSDRRQPGCCVDAVRRYQYYAQRNLGRWWSGFSTAVLHSDRLHIRHRLGMVAVERQFMDTNRRYRSVWWCANSNSDAHADSNSNSDADSNSDSITNADRRVAKQYARPAGDFDYRQRRCRLDSYCQRRDFAQRQLISRRIGFANSLL